MKAIADVAHSFTLESGPGGRRCRPSHSTGLLYPSWRRRMNCLQVNGSTEKSMTVRNSDKLPFPMNPKGALMFIIFTAHFQWGASERIETLVDETVRGAWNKTLYKTEGRCLLFRSNATQYQFYYWPEDDPGFDHCCSSDVNLDLSQNFTYGKYGPRLGYVEYHDLGLIDQCLPYWRCLHLFERMFKTSIYYIKCEFTDIRKLYKLRFFSDTLFKRGLLQSALPLILFSEILVILSIALYRFIRRRRPGLNESRDIMIGASKTWLRDMRKTVLMDWTHLYLLATIGNGLIDAVGRQNPYKPQSKSFYNYGQLYVVLSILVACSSVLHQITSWIAEMDEAADDSQTTADLSNFTSGEAISSRHASKPVELEKKIGLNDDWKWQPIAAQLATVFCLSGFLTYPNPDPSNDTAGTVIGIVVSAACPWSGLYASKVIVQTVPWLLRRVYQNPSSRRRNYRGLWRSVLHLQQWQAVVLEPDTALLDRRTRPRFWSLWKMTTQFRASLFIWKIAQILLDKFVSHRFLLLL